MSSSIHTPYPYWQDSERPDPPRDNVGGPQLLAAMLLPLLVLAALTSAPASALTIAPAADSTVWLVDNHGRKAGDLVVTTRGDTTIARYIYTDRNRGGRIEVRQVMRNGRLASAESRPINLDGTTGAPTEPSASESTCASAARVLTLWP